MLRLKVLQFEEFDVLYLNQALSNLLAFISLVLVSGYVFCLFGRNSGARQHALCYQHYDRDRVYAIITITKQMIVLRPHILVHACVAYQLIRSLSEGQDLTYFTMLYDWPLCCEETRDDQEQARHR